MQYLQIIQKHPISNSVLVIGWSALFRVLATQERLHETTIFATDAACHCATNEKDQPIRKCSQNWFQENDTGHLCKEKHSFQ